MLIDARELSRITGTAPRRVRRALAKIAAGKVEVWRGWKLEVVTMHGRGGASGKSYLVKVSSLPAHLQDRLKALETPVETRSIRPTTTGSAAERAWWTDLLSPVMACSKGSAERHAAYVEITQRRLVDWSGRRLPKLSIRTLQRRMERMEKAGSIGPLTRSGRADKGKKRVFLSRAWDAAVPFEDAIKAKIAENLRQQIRGYVKKGTQPKELVVLAQRFLVNDTRAWGYRTSDAATLERVCRIPKHLIQAERIYRKVYRHNFDRKASEDDRPRVKRTIAGLQPMEIVVMDVHPIDIYVARTDGTVATPKMLGFHDLATGRVWAELVFLDKRGGVRNTDLIEAFAAMARARGYGLPQMIMIDNGSEYYFADFLDDALKLAIPFVSTDGKVRASRIIRCLPYNAAAKPIERVHAHLEQHFFRHSPGYIGGDRMNKKQHEIGKQVAPFSGGIEAFEPYFRGLINAYHKVPHTSGENKGRSPEQVFADHVAAGWQAAIMDPENLLSVFTRPETRKVRQHTVSVDGRTWTGPELDTYLGETVTVQVPAYHGFNELLLIGEDGKELGVVRPQEVFSYTDPRGAKRSASRTKERNNAIRKLDRSAPDIDVGGELIAWGREQPDTVPNEPRGVVSITKGVRAKVITPEGAPKSAEELARAERKEIQELRAQVVANLKRAAS